MKTNGCFAFGYKTAVHELYPNNAGLYSFIPFGSVSPSLLTIRWPCTKSSCGLFRVCIGCTALGIFSSVFSGISGTAPAIVSCGPVRQARISVFSARFPSSTPCRLSLPVEEFPFPAPHFSSGTGQ